MRQITVYPSLTTDELIEELAEVNALLKASFLQRSTAQQEYDRTSINRYYQSHGHSVAERDREAEYAAQTEKESLTEFEHQVLVHTAVRDFLVQLIGWRA